MKKKKVLIIIAFVVAAALVGTGGFVWYQKRIMTQRRQHSQITRESLMLM